MCFRKRKWNLRKKSFKILFFHEHEHHSLQEYFPQHCAKYVDQHFERKHFENNLFILHRNRDETNLDQELKESWGLCYSSLNHQIWDTLWWQNLHVGSVNVIDWRWVETWKCQMTKGKCKLNRAGTPPSLHYPLCMGKANVSQG